MRVILDNSNAERTPTRSPHENETDGGRKEYSMHGGMDNINLNNSRFIN